MNNFFPWTNVTERLSYFLASATQRDQLYVVKWQLVSVRTFSVMYDHILFYVCKTQNQTSLHKQHAQSALWLQTNTLIFLKDLYAFNTLTLSSLRSAFYHYKCNLTIQAMYFPTCHQRFNRKTSSVNIYGVIVTSVRKKFHPYSHLSESQYNEIWTKIAKKIWWSHLHNVRTENAQNVEVNYCIH